MLEQPFVSIIIPCRNEEKYIEKCLRSLAKDQDYPKDKMEILVVDGMSEDKTREMVDKCQKEFSFIRLLENKNKFTPFALNIGIRTAKGEIIVRVDAHAEYQSDYVSICIADLEKYKNEGVENVGGIVQPALLENLPDIKSRAIAICMSSFFGVASRFRIGSKEPVFTDTVFGGCYRKDIFDKVGYFNEKLIRSQDLEFNLRLQRAGKKILLDPKITLRYYPKTDLAEFFWHNFEDGIWATYPLKFTRTAFKLRHYIPLLFVGSLIVSLVFSPFSFYFRLLFDLIFGSYLLLSLFFSFRIAIREGLKYFLLMPVVFASRHFGYGLGSIVGLFKIFLS